MIKQFTLSLLALFSFLTASEKPPEPVVILGGGVGSLTSALYLARAGLQPIVIEGRQAGGLLTQSHSVQNWPGEMDIIGRALTDKIRAQAEANGARILEAEVVGIDFSKRPLNITIRSLEAPHKTDRIAALSCIIGMGTEPNFLNVPGEQTFWGRGVTNCAICDGSLYKDLKVGVVGGGDAAVLEALYLSNIAKEVHLFVRKDQLRANEGARIKTLMEKPNVIFHYNTEVVAVKGDDNGVTGVSLNTGKLQPIDGLFLAIGSRPNSKMFQKVLELDERGYIVLKKTQETTVPGVYAIGDIVDPVYKQAVSAAGDGAKAALQAQEYLMDKWNALALSKKGEKKEPPQKSEVVEILTAEQFEKVLKDTDVPVIVDFYATWCSPCKSVSPMIESSAVKYAGKVKFLKVNVDTCGDLGKKYQIRKMPTVLLIDLSGKVQEKKVGMEQIGEFLEKLSTFQDNG